MHHCPFEYRTIELKNKRDLIPYDSLVKLLGLFGKNEIVTLTDNHHTKQSDVNLKKNSKSNQPHFYYSYGQFMMNIRSTILAEMI